MPRRLLSQKASASPSHVISSPWLSEQINSRALRSTASRSPIRPWGNIRKAQLRVLAFKESNPCRGEEFKEATGLMLAFTEGSQDIGEPADRKRRVSFRKPEPDRRA